jgi:hypothetical protein
MNAQSIEEFMREYFMARIADAEREQRSRAAYRSKYYTPDCLFDSREGTVEMIKSEQIVGVTANGDGGEVITTVRNPLFDHPPGKQRYLLIGFEGGLLIREVQLACYSCDGKSGNVDCIFCHGQGWTSVQSRRRRNTS